MPIPETDPLTRDKFLNTLAESYVLHETILNSTELAVISANPDGIINSFNTSAEKLLGFEPDDLIGKETLLVVHDQVELRIRGEELSKLHQNAAGVEVLLSHARSARTSERREWTWITKAGKKIPVSVSLSAIRNEKDELTGFLYIATDITGQRKTDEELRESRNHLQALIQSLDDIAFEIDRQGNYLNVWTSRDDLLFEQKNYYVGRNIRDVVKAELAQAYLQAIPRVLDSGKAETFEHPTIRPNSDIWYSVKITKLSPEHVLVLVREITERKKAELALVESEKKFRLLAENVPGVIYLCRNDKNYSNVFVSANIEKLTGYPYQDFLGTIDLVQCVHPDDADFVMKAFVDAVEQRKSFNLEYRVVHKSGEIKWVKESGAGLYSEHGLELIEGYISDITKRKVAELALQKSEQKFRLMAENIPGVIYLCNNDEKFSMVYLNPNVEQLTGYSAEEFIEGKISFVDLFHPDDSPRIFSKVDEALSSKQRFHIEYRLQKKSGEWRWVEEVGEGVYNEGEVFHLEGFISDITERKKAESELRTVANENFRIFNYSPCLQVVGTFDGKFKRLNPMWEKTLGWSIDELMKMRALELFHPEDIALADSVAPQILKNKSITGLECRLRCKDGTYRWVLFSASVDEETKLVSATGLDITERKKSEEALLMSKTNLEVAAQELQEQNRQSNEFAHIISHNLRSPARNIQALISLVNENSTVQEYRDVFDNLKKTSSSLVETLEELLDILKVKKGAEMELTDVSFKEVLDKAKHDLLGEIITTNTKINADFTHCKATNYYKPYLESIFLNLLSNAIKYRFPGRNPEVTFKTSSRNGRCFLEVSDNGLGIDMSRFAEQLFGLRKVFHEHKESRGVGLFLTKTQVEAMGGRIWAESKVGVGSSFFVSF